MALLLLRGRYQHTTRRRSLLPGDALNPDMPLQDNVKLSWLQKQRCRCRRPGAQCERCPGQKHSRSRLCLQWDRRADQICGKEESTSLAGMLLDRQVLCNIQLSIVTSTLPLDE